MKMRVPADLMTVAVAAMSVAPVAAAIRHTDASLQTYVDFATNSGRFVAEGSTNALLDDIRKREGGVRISYATADTKSQLLPNGMLSFDSVADLGNATAVGYNYIVTVAHNGVLDPTFNASTAGVGDGLTIRYKGIEETSTNGCFVHSITGNEIYRDYKITRLSKVVTDATPATLYAPTIVNGTTDMKGALVYRVGGGEQLVRTEAGDSKQCDAGFYLVGGVGSMTEWTDHTDYATGVDVKQGVITGQTSWASGAGAGEGTPLPFGSTGGDSGSPYFVYDEQSKSFQLLMAHTGSVGGNTMYASSAPVWSQNTMDGDNVYVDMGTVKGTLVLDGATKSEDKGGVQDTINGVSVTVAAAQGFLKHDDRNLYDEAGNAVSFKGVATGQHTWKDLSALKNNDAWYAYGNEYLNATESVVVNADKEVLPATGITYAELFQTQNLVFNAAENDAEYSISVTADTDLGVGYLHFAAEKVSNVVYNISSADNKLLNAAGYVVDAGVQVNVSLRNADADYMREWRKVGEGTLRICGSGNNEIFLNIGGGGETWLNQKKGYAAYNVLVNTGATVKIADASQIARDLTFGNGGGVLDLNGISMDWYTTKGEEREGFSIQALTEEAVISNSSATKAMLTFKETGEQRFVGSFADSSLSALAIVYDGAGTWELNGIHTALQHKDSGFTVKSGTVRLSGTHTVHGVGSATGTDAARYTHEDDWHYADATMNVTVETGGTFELAGHARLTGDVVVKSGGAYIMREGVNHAMEYIEGGEALESTGGDVAKYYGHKGNVQLHENAVMKVQYTAGTDTATTYAYQVSGPGALVVDLGTDAAPFIMTGDVKEVSAVEVVGKSKLELGSQVSVSALNEEGKATFSGVSLMNAEQLAGAVNSPLLVKNASVVVAEGSSYKIAHAHLEGAFIDAKANSTLVLSHVHIAANSKLTDDPAMLSVEQTTLDLELGTNATVGDTFTLGSPMTLATPIGSQTWQAAATESITRISSTALNAFTLSGTSLTLDLTGADLGFDGVALTLNGVAVGDWLAVSFSDGTPVEFQTSLPVMLTFSGIKELADLQLAGYYETGNAPTTTVYFHTRYIPEPTASALSLLALVACCIRRKRR